MARGCARATTDVCWTGAVPCPSRGGGRVRRAGSHRLHRAHYADQRRALDEHDREHDQLGSTDPVDRQTDPVARHDPEPAQPLPDGAGSAPG